MKPEAGTLSRPAVAAAGRTERILFAFTAGEREIFLPGFREADFSAHAHLYVDPNTTGADGWERLLRDWKPTAMVTAWSTKRIPAAWVASEEFSLRYVCHVAGSLRKVMGREVFERGVRATNWGDTINHTIAEHAVLMVLALLRGVSRWPASIDRGGWTVDHVNRLNTRSLRGKRVGLHGFGAIAREVVAMLKPFQPSEIAVHSRGVPPEFIESFGASPCASLDELFAGSEVLVECESLTPASRGSVDGRMLGLLADDAVFVNVGRGHVVDEAALLREAGSGRLRIGLDVFHKEPLEPDSPLRAAPGILLSPHIAGPTRDTYHLCGEHALGNLRRYLAGGPLSGEVTAGAFDRMT